MNRQDRPRSDGEDALRTEFRRLSPKVTGGLLRMRQEAYRDARVPGRYKLLAAMAISIAIRCEPCVRAYARMAHDKGVSPEEVMEFLDVAMTMQGCPGEEWALKAFEAYTSSEVEGSRAGASQCCHQ